jgi:hypothetical protein
MSVRLSGTYTHIRVGQGWSHLEGCVCTRLQPTQAQIVRLPESPKNDTSCVMLYREVILIPRSTSISRDLLCASLELEFDANVILENMIDALVPLVIDDFRFPDRCRVLKLAKQYCLRQESFQVYYAELERGLHGRMESALL